MKLFLLDIFKQTVGIVSNKNPTDITPAHWTFSIWGIIYLWQGAWLIYAISRILRKSNIDYLYIIPNTLHPIVFISYIINMGLNIGWLFIWDREYFGWSFFVVFLMFITIIIPMIITHVLLQQNRLIYIDSKRTTDIWLVRLLVHNGLAIYCTWVYFALLLNLTVWLCQIYNRIDQSIIDVSTVSLTFLFIGIIIYFILENFIFYISMSYTYSPWFVLIFSLTGILSKNSNRNQVYTIILFIICCILFFIRVGLFIIRYIKERIPTIENP